MNFKKATSLFALLMVASLALAAPGSKQSTGYGLETKDQQWVEAQALRLMESPLVKAAQKEVEQTYRDDPAFSLPGAAATAQEAAYELTYRTAEYVTTEDPVRPKFLWTYNATRKSRGIQIPGTTFIESVDSIYRVLTIGKGYHYEITGKRPKNGPAFITFEVWNSAQGLQPTVKYVTHLQESNMEFGADGSFKILAGPEPADGRKNYLHTPEGGWLLVRQSLSDWSNQSIIENMKVQLLDRADRPAPTFAELEKRLIEVMPMSTMVNRTYMHRMFEEATGSLYVSFGNTLNHLKPTVATRGGAWGYVTGTTYQIPRDKAFVVTIATDDARYSAIQLHDAWGRTLDPVYMTNRNNGISTRNPDGTITYVLSERDPGVANWLDTRGIESGSLIMRWQGVTPPADGSQASMVRDAQLVAFDDLKSVLPKDVPMITADARRAELQRRKIAFERRLR
jgi:Protein of unknown function (DUF1214)